jgi:hypothetical protein
MRIPTASTVLEAKAVVALDAKESPAEGRGASLLSASRGGDVKTNYP